MNPRPLMVATRRPLHAKEETAREIYRLAERFADDLGGAAKLPLPVFFRRVADIPYRRDQKGLEVVARPKWALELGRRIGIDCKKKAGLILAWMKKRGIPSRLVGSSSKRAMFGVPPIHHVFPQGFFCDMNRRCGWRNVDATYPHYNLFEPKRGITRAVVFARG